jgi:hypothetical protein
MFIIVLIAAFNLALHLLAASRRYVAAERRTNLRREGNASSRPDPKTNA